MSKMSTRLSPGSFLSLDDVTDLRVTLIFTVVGRSVPTSLKGPVPDHPEL